MREITFHNIENHIELFDGNTDFSKVSWIEPVFVSMVKAYRSDIGETIRVQKDAYLKNMLTQSYTEGKTYSPVEHIDNRLTVEKVADHITSILLQNFNDLKPVDRKDLRDYLQYLFSELMNNVADHSRSDVGGYAMAQYYPQKSKVQFAVADRGVGFLANIRLTYAEIKSEAEAIRKALEKGVTSTPARMYAQPQNAGYGLYALFKIIELTGGEFLIISNDTIVRYDGENITHKKMQKTFKGSVIAFEFYEHNINHDIDYFLRTYLWNDLDDEEDFF